MHDKIRIDLSTGLMIDVVSPYDSGEDIIDEPCPDGFILPKWDGTQWVEGGTPPEPVITVDMLKQELADTDYRIIKCYEYSLVNLPLPYDIEALHAERQAVRDKIDALQTSETTV